jgi:hypothetical protein
MSAKDFNNAVEIGKTRSVMNNFLGEIITQVVGNDRVQKLFEGQSIPEDLAGKSTGEIALKLGVITPDTKTGLLVAQAAERTLRLAEKIEALSITPVEDKEKREALYTSLSYVQMDSPVFKFVGSENDPDVLKSAQATWMAAQMYLNNEIDAVLYVSPFPLEQRVAAAGKGFVDGLKKKAADDYARASFMLEGEGHDDAVARLSAVSAHISAGIKNPASPSPQTLVETLLFNEAWSVGETNQQFGMWSTIKVDPRTGFDDESGNRIIRLINKVSKPPSAATTPRHA